MKNHFDLKSAAIMLTGQPEHILYRTIFTHSTVAELQPWVPVGRESL